MSFAFESHVLPVLQDMARDPLADNYPVRRRMLELGVVGDGEQADRLLELMRSDGYLTFGGQQNGAHKWPVLFEVRLTAKALKQLDLWPDDHERGLYLLHRLVDAFDAVAADMENSENVEPDRAVRLRDTAKLARTAVREVGTEIASKVIANMATGS